MTSKPSPQLARENPDPRESSNPLPIVFLLFFATTAAIALTYLVKHHATDEAAIAGDQRSPQRVVTTEVTGEAVYQKVCAACHQGTGLGVPSAFPPLAGSPWLLEDPETPIRVVLLGLSGPIVVDGKTYASVMPAFGPQLSDNEVALVVSYARSSFGNQAPAVTAEDVAAVRASLAGRTEPWAGGAALEAAREAKPLPASGAP